MAGNTASIAFILAVILVFLVLAAQYESWSLPLAVILVVPMCLLSSITGVLFARMDVNIFTQIGFVVLVGLACKNAILIVEFARARRNAGVGLREATLEACRLRLRPIIMTSLAFIFGVIPLVIGEGAGAEMRSLSAQLCSPECRRHSVRHLPDAAVLLRHPTFHRMGLASPRLDARRSSSSRSRDSLTGGVHPEAVSEKSYSRLTHGRCQRNRVVIFTTGPFAFSRNKQWLP